MAKTKTFSGGTIVSLRFYPEVGRVDADGRWTGPSGEVEPWAFEWTEGPEGRQFKLETADLQRLNALAAKLLRQAARREIDEELL